MWSRFESIGVDSTFYIPTTLGIVFAEEEETVKEFCPRFCSVIFIYLNNLKI
jgi:hypothetical protein